MTSLHRTLGFLVLFVVWALALFALPVVALHLEVVNELMAGRLPLSLSAVLSAIGGQNWPMYLVFAIGAGFIAAHRTAGTFSFRAVASQQRAEPIDFHSAGAFPSVNGASGLPVGPLGIDANGNALGHDNTREH
jgi:hypothetical protein